jgi:DUF4097 and DUF4098 domain-containing protein YvlB
VFVTLLAASARADEWSKRFEVTGRPELRIEADDAAVALRAGSGGAVEARVTTRGWRIGPDGVRVNARQNGNRVEIEVRVPDNEWGLGTRSVRLEVLVPPDLRAEVHTGDGSIRAEALKGDFRFTTGDGGIEAESLDGALTARTGDGRLSARGRFDQLDLRTNDGSIVAAFNPGSKMAGPWRIETGDGSVTVRVPEGFAADIDAHTGDGHISIGLPITTSGFNTGENTFRGHLHGGGLPLRIRTGDGSIRIERM